MPFISKAFVCETNGKYLKRRFRCLALGWLALRGLMVPDSLLAIQQAVEEDPFDASLRVELGDRLAMNGDHLGALAAYSDALGLKPHDGQAMRRKDALERKLRGGAAALDGAKLAAVEEKTGLLFRGNNSTPTHHSASCVRLGGTACAVAWCLTALAACPPATKAVLARHQLRLPVTLTTAQMASGALLFGLIRFISRFLLHRAPRVKWVDAAPVGICFGLKLALMNVGLAGSATTTHVLLQATDVVWAAVAARCIALESLGSTLGIVAIAGCAAGAAFVGFTSVAHAPPHSPHPLVALIANLTAPALQGLVIALLRVGVLAAMRREQHRPTLLFLVDFTAVKLAFAFLAAATLALVVERRSACTELVAYAELGVADARALALSATLVAIIQLSFTALAALVSAPTVGVIATLKVVPQVIVAAIVDPKLHAQQAQRPDYYVGAALILLSSLLWAVSLLLTLSLSDACPLILWFGPPAG